MSNYESFRDLEDRGVDLIELLAGDQSFGSDAFLEVVNRVQRAGDDLYSDLLFLLTHRRFPPATAVSLWRGILEHKESLTATLGRNPGVRVAAADYLTNVRELLERPRILDRGDFETVLHHVAVDALTGLSNRRAIHTRLDRELRRSRRYQKDFSLLVIDLDKFKEINDTYGHAAGDRVLVGVSERFLETCRETDGVGRTGGDEFLILLPETPGDSAVALAERVRQRVAETPLEIDDEGGTVRLSISIGVASFPTEGRDAETLLARADGALYAGKRGGRGTVERAE